MYNGSSAPHVQQRISSPSLKRPGGHFPLNGRVASLIKEAVPLRTIFLEPQRALLQFSSFGFLLKY
jgi:hypothetical protein